MKFIKNNLVPVICGVVVLLAIGAWFWPIGAWISEHQAVIKDRYDQAAIADGLTKPLPIPGTQPAAPIDAHVVKAAKENNLDAAAEPAGALQKTCKACHDLHREQLPDKTFKFKP